MLNRRLLTKRQTRIKKKSRHIIFWKMSAILLMLLAMEGGMTGTALYLTYKLKGDANAINYAGHERWRT